MYKLYYLVSETTEKYYIGITKNSLRQRYSQHKHRMNSDNNLPLYNAMRKYGDFKIVFADEYDTKEEACDAEIQAIKLARDSGHDILNVSDGGDCGNVAHDKELWKQRLREARKGRKPALGMKHTEENKRFFSECAKRKQIMYNENDLIGMSFKTASIKFGISKTHYYRLLKRIKDSDLN